MISGIWLLEPPELDTTAAAACASLDWLEGALKLRSRASSADAIAEYLQGLVSAFGTMSCPDCVSHFGSGKTALPRKDETALRGALSEPFVRCDCDFDTWL